MKTPVSSLILAFMSLAAIVRANEAPLIPHLEKLGTVIQLIVDNKPFLILGGELQNSSSASLEHMNPIWDRLGRMHLNTVLTPISWELIEPEEGKFDFKLVDGLIHDARQNNLRLVFLWFGSWKNSMSCYAPAWVLQEHKDALLPEFRALWEKAGFKTSGAWEEVFGPGIGTEEIFMAWHFARYAGQVAAQGKAEYPLPMYVNAALIRPNYKPGQYPSAGPLPHLLDVWRAAAPRIDFLSPDIYFPNFAEWCDNYHRSGNPLFIPEAIQDTANLFYAFGQCDAMGFSPFGIDTPLSAPGAGESSPQRPALERCYAVLSQLAPLILENQGKGSMAGVLLDQTNQTQSIRLGNFTLKVAHDGTWGGSRALHPSPWPRFGGLILSLGHDEYLVAGAGLIVTFSSNSPEEPIAGIVSIDEGSFEKGRWVAERRLNGDETHQGRHLRLVPGQCGLQRVKLYRYH